MRLAKVVAARSIPMVIARSIPVVVMAFAILAVGYVPTVMLGCGGNQRQQMLRTSLVAVNAARDGFVTWDAAHQAQIVAMATSKEDGRARLDAYRTDRAKLVDTFELVYRVIAIAATQSDESSLDAALRASKRLLDSIEKLQGGP